MTALALTISVTWSDVWSVGKYALPFVGGLAVAFVLFCWWLSKVRIF